MIRRNFLKCLSVLPLTSLLNLIKSEPVLEPIFDASMHIQHVNIISNLKHEEIFELGRRGPYYRYINFPIKQHYEFIRIEC